VDPGGIASWGTVAGGSIGDTGAGGGCFIATAAFGSKMERNVQILSDFRDKRLSSNRIGRGIVKLYYKLSPPLANYLYRHPFARTAVKYALMPLTGVAYLALYIHPVVLFAGLFLLLFMIRYCLKHQGLLVQN
jgi:hypothetical protein